MPRLQTHKSHILCGFTCSVHSYKYLCFRHCGQILHHLESLFWQATWIF